MNILFINYYCPGREPAERFNYNYGPGRMAAYLKVKGAGGPLKMEIHSCEVPPSRKFITDCISFGPDVAGISCFLWSHHWVTETIAALRESLPGCLIVLGGPSAPFLYERHKGFGGHPVYAVRGSGEVPFAQFARLATDNGARWDQPPPVDRLLGIAGGNLYEQPAGELPETLDFLPSPYISGVLRPGRGAQVLYLEGSRWCGRNCAFCSYGKYSAPEGSACFSPEYIRKELEWARGKGLLFFDFFEASVTRDPGRIGALAQHILDADPDGRFRFTFNIHPSDIAPEVMTTLSRLGDRLRLTIGVQSLSPGAMKTMHRHTNIEKLESDIAEFARQFPIKVEFIAGTPGDTPDEFESAIARIARLPVRIAVYRLLLTPGCEYFDRREEYDLRYDEDQLFQITETPAFSADYLASLGDRLRRIVSSAGRGELEYSEGTAPVK